MKPILLICALCGAGWLPGHAQTIRTMTEQLIALKTLATTTHQGYSLVTTGLQNIGSATDKEARLHQTYIQSLSKVNPVFIKQNSSTTKAVNYDSSLLHPIHQPVAHK